MKCLVFIIKILHSFCLLSVFNWDFNDAMGKKEKRWDFYLAVELSCQLSSCFKRNYSKLLHLEFQRLGLLVGFYFGCELVNVRKCSEIGIFEYTYLGYIWVNYISLVKLLFIICTYY